MIARRILGLAVVATAYWRATEPPAPEPALDEPTREYEPVDLDEVGPRVARQIHGLTASELAAADRAQMRHLRRIEMELIGDADFRTLAASLLDEFPDQT